MATRIGLSNRLLGRIARRRTDLGANDYKFDFPWGGKPNINDEFFGVIEAAWLTAEQEVKVAIRDPHGNVFEAYLTHITLDTA